MSFSIRLTRDGLRHEGDRDGETTVRTHRPSSVPELLRFWHHRLAGIDDDVTLGDLLSLLRDVEGIGELSPMLCCAVEEFLDEAEEPPLRGRATDVRYLEVCNTAWLDGYEPRGHDRRVRRGRFVPPYHISRDFQGWGPWDDASFGGNRPEDAPREGGIAIEFTPVNELVHLPLRYNPKIVFTSDLYGGETLLDTELTIDFGEFVHAIFWEIGFLGSPGDRNEKRAELEATIDEIDAGEAQLIPMEDLFAELDLDPDEEAPPGDTGSSG